MPSVQIVDLAKKVEALRETASEKKAVHDKVVEDLNDTEMNLYQQMESEGVKNFKLEGIGTFYHFVRPWAKIVDPTKAEAYLKEKGLWDQIMQLKPISGRLNTLMTEEYLEKGDPIPEVDIGIAVVLKPRIGLRRG